MRHAGNRIHLRPSRLRVSVPRSRPSPPPPARCGPGCPGASVPWFWDGVWARRRSCCITCCPDGFEVVVEESIYRAVEAYREGGVRFPGAVEMFNGHWPDGTVALFPPGRSSGALNGYRYQRTMELTGWAVSGSRGWRRPRRLKPALQRPRRLQRLAGLCGKGKPPAGLHGLRLPRPSCQTADNGLPGGASGRQGRRKRGVSDANGVAGAFYETPRLLRCREII